METIDIKEAETHLHRLIDRLANEGGFIIARAGQPVARLVSLNSTHAGKEKRLGFMVGQLKVPPDFDRMGGDDITGTF